MLCRTYITFQLSIVKSIKITIGIDTVKYGASWALTTRYFIILYNSTMLGLETIILVLMVNPTNAAVQLNNKIIKQKPSINLNHNLSTHRFELIYTRLV